MKKKYKCSNCDFSFESERDMVKCPYCDKATLCLDMRDEELIKDVDSLLK